MDALSGVETVLFVANYSPLPVSDGAQCWARASLQPWLRYWAVNTSWSQPVSLCALGTGHTGLVLDTLPQEPLHSGQAGGQNSWETKFHKRVRQSGQMIGLHGHDHESLFGTLGSLIGPLEAPQNDQKPLKMAISGTFKHPSQT